MSPQELSKKLCHIGLITARQLIEGGIDSPSMLRTLGAEAVYERLCTHKDFCGRYNVVYLYALEGAILDCHWQAIPQARKERYKALTKRLRKSAKALSARDVLRLPA